MLSNRATRANPSPLTPRPSESATGVATSHVGLSDGVNADNTRACVKVLRDHGYDGNLSIECEGQSRLKALAWMRQTFSELGIERKASGLPNAFVAVERHSLKKTGLTTK